ncbi:MAG TPA: hypothetical protein VIR59_11915 [Gaiellaceae bacterium]|jgi:hypothetical protein
MAKKSSTKRGAAIIALIAALAALAGPGAASAAPKTTAPTPAVSVSVGGFGEIASWAEDASWAS